jgi:hypothetical protein
LVSENSDIVKDAAIFQSEAIVFFEHEGILEKIVYSNMEL